MKGHYQLLLLTLLATGLARAEIEQFNETQGLGTDHCATGDGVLCDATKSDIDALLDDHFFPQAGQPATIQQGDEHAQQLWSEIREAHVLPDDVEVKPKSTSSHFGTNGTGYNTTSDPDCWYTATKCTTPKHANLTGDLAACLEPDTLGLALSSGENGTHSDLFDLLDQHKLKATLFYSGSNVRSSPSDARRALSDGHVLCGHSWSQRSMTTLSNEDAFAELFYTAKAIKLATGVTPLCWRAPFGDVDDRIRAIATGLGLETVSQDKKEAYSMSTFVSNYTQLNATDKKLVPVTTCRNVTFPYAENITYPDFEQFIQGNYTVPGLPSNDTLHENLLGNFSAISLLGGGHASSHASSHTSSSSTSHAGSSGGSAPKAPPPPANNGGDKGAPPPYSPPANNGGNNGGDKDAPPPYSPPANNGGDKGAPPANNGGSGNAGNAAAGAVAGGAAGAAGGHVINHNRPYTSSDAASDPSGTSNSSSTASTPSESVVTTVMKDSTSVYTMTSHPSTTATAIHYSEHNSAAGLSSAKASLSAIVCTLAAVSFVTVMS